MNDDQCIRKCSKPGRTEQALFEKISHAEVTLDRTIGFINNSESKTGITLTMVGVILTIIFTLSGNNIMIMFNEVLNNPGPTTIAFIIIFSATLLATLYGIYKLINVLTPKLDAKEHEDGKFECDSRIFFGRIASGNERYSQFRNKMLDYSSEDYLNDLWSQIYINSNICKKKFRNFYIGLRVAIPSLLLLLATVIVFGFIIME